MPDSDCHRSLTPPFNDRETEKNKGWGGVKGRLAGNSSTDTFRSAWTWSLALLAGLSGAVRYGFNYHPLNFKQFRGFICWLCLLSLN